MLGNVSFGELMIIMLAVLLVFGAKRIPDVARGLGQGLREFKSAMNEISRDLQIDDRPPHRPPSDPGRHRETPPAAA